MENSLFGTGPGVGTGISEPYQRCGLIVPAGADIVTICDCYDLTLVVSKNFANTGSKVFRVSRSTLCSVSAVWRSILTDSFVEVSQSIVSFPDDDPGLFLIILQIAHWNHRELPEYLNLSQLLSLAGLVDKYALGHIVRLIIKEKQWLKQYIQEVDNTNSPGELQRMILITEAFEFQSDYERITDRASMKLRSSTNYGMGLAVMNICGTDTRLPNRILSKYSRSFACRFTRFP
ncbi:hypothetical protein B0J11DRAFT_442714 [Dendryphion nanum]|uniref:BTB domain-containing protein n=1 Tax=Dendryphion nanum TaxID=256645 RepID=A0A9P9DB00_9PLEO|nr:hypothetical protein B0J11DRAFT_442714 [Dendryphion nanum]